MMYILKALAALLVLAVAKTVSGEYKKFTDRKLRIDEGFVSLLSFIKSELSCRGRTVSEWACDFKNDELSELGFCSSLVKSGKIELFRG